MNTTRNTTPAAAAMILAEPTSPEEAYARMVDAETVRVLAEEVRSVRPEEKR